jgi:hypothetical protein
MIHPLFIVLIKAGPQLVSRRNAEAQRGRASANISAFSAPLRKLKAALIPACAGMASGVGA